MWIAPARPIRQNYCYTLFFNTSILARTLDKKSSRCRYHPLRFWRNNVKCAKFTLILYKYWNTRDELDFLPKTPASLDLVENKMYVDTMGGSVRRLSARMRFALLLAKSTA